ncbi:hypothetical protein [Amycolatopsis kentuckyensis]|uniref:hypothetical protein n=1 Tax=Amycolatopsis kentuckyensis TaxID=218823 RepID=UPI000A3B654B|nr:hypothetical protein [Amycolatopsis kentuckyensis]
MQNITTAATPPDPQPQPPTAGVLLAARLVALLPRRIPPWLPLLALFAVIGTVATIVLAIVHSIGPTLATAGALSSATGAGIHWRNRHTGDRANTRP